jgi:FkbM family methyltransferase
MNHRRGRPLKSEELRFANLSFSQFGEDLAVARLLRERGIAKGTYADFGAYDPILFSNTLLLKIEGWRGLNVDASDEAIQQFNLARKEDSNVVAIVSDREEEFTFAEYGHKTTNRIVPNADGANRDSLIGERPLSTRKVKSVTGRRLLEDSPFRAGVDYINIDCEGHDFEVLRGIDLAVYRPAVLTVETEMSEQGPDIKAYCKAHGYELREVHSLTSVFVREA